jgi:hypothetical protein
VTSQDWIWTDFTKVTVPVGDDQVNFRLFSLQPVPKGKIEVAPSTVKTRCPKDDADLPPEYKKFYWEFFDEEARSRLTSAVQSSRWLTVLSGKHGRAKSSIVGAYIRYQRAIGSDNWQKHLVKFTANEQLKSDLFNFSKDKETWRSVSDLLVDELKCAYILVIDDLCAGVDMKNPQQVAQASRMMNMLQPVFESRCADARKTIITTNRTPQELAKILGGSAGYILSRMSAGTWFDVVGDDLRAKMRVPPVIPVQATTPAPAAPATVARQEPEVTTTDKPPAVRPVSNQKTPEDEAMQRQYDYFKTRINDAAAKYQSIALKFPNQDVAELAQPRLELIGIVGDYEEFRIANVDRSGLKDASSTLRRLKIEQAKSQYQPAVRVPRLAAQPAAAKDDQTTRPTGAEQTESRLPSQPFPVPGTRTIGVAPAVFAEHKSVVEEGRLAVAALEDAYAKKIRRDLTAEDEKRLTDMVVAAAARVKAFQRQHPEIAAASATQQAAPTPQAGAQPPRAA